MFTQTKSKSHTKKGPGRFHPATAAETQRRKQLQAEAKKARQP